MKKISILWLVLVSLALAPISTPAGVHKKEQSLRSEVETLEGKNVRLFHSGTEDVKKTFCRGDLVPVFREVYAFGALKRKLVGKIRINTYIGKHYLEATVVEGKLRRGDVAQKGSAACLIYPPAEE